jgi:hypothetical protein
MKVNIEGKTLKIEMLMQPPTPSASGKTLVVATTRGNAKTGAMIDGKQLVIGLNAYIAR